MKTAEVLVVEDEDDVRGLVRVLLERAGLTVARRPDGLEALRCLYDSAPDLVVLDVAMPELDGWQTLERIRDLSDVPVLMLTARDGELEKVRGLRAAPTTTSRSRSGARSCWHASRRCCAAPAGQPEARGLRRRLRCTIDYVSAR